MELKKMKTITLEYDGRNRTLTTLLELMLEKGARVVSRKQKTGLDEAIEDEKAGRVNSYDSVDDFFDKMYQECTK